MEHNQEHSEKLRQLCGRRFNGPEAVNLAHHAHVGRDRSKFGDSLFFFAAKHRSNLINWLRVGRLLNGNTDQNEPFQSLWSSTDGHLAGCHTVKFDSVKLVIICYYYVM